MDIFQKAKEAIDSADYLVITAGAGMGVDSGLPDFRGVEGFWRAYPFAKKLGIRFEELANPIWFEKKPHMAWAFYGHRLNLYRKTTPHIGFKILLDSAKSKNDYFVITSNVDGQFQKAGFSKEKIDEIHGSIHYLQCQDYYCKSGIWSAKDVEIEIDLENFIAKEPLPTCPLCNKIARPNILMFGDLAWKGERERAQRANLEIFLQQLEGKKLTIIEIGAGKAVPTIRYISEDLAKEFDGTLIRINPRDYDAPAGAISIPFGAKEAIEKIFLEK
ncbi:MAG: NAD-dependent deacetylase [Epsilonproteobacteria bacterium]|nr:NAD-dependent deacetylase [Campylobacterota bacterium]